MIIEMSSTDIVVTIFSGILLGISFSLVTFGFFSDKKVQRECFMASAKLYQEILLKKSNKKYTYSKPVRQVINKVHASILLQGSATGFSPKSLSSASIPDTQS